MYDSSPAAPAHTQRALGAPIIWGIAGAAALLASSCVPRERTDRDSDVVAVPAASTGEAAPSAPPPQEESEPEPGVSVAPVERDPVAPLQKALATTPPDPVLAGVFVDDFNRTGSRPSDLGSAWRPTSAAWTLSDGRLCGENARNHPVWLAKRLPVNAVIEFQASTGSSDGDIKAEFWGDGSSAATGQSYTDATSYLTVFGGWKNTFHVLARLDEHAPDRQEIKLVPQGADFIRSRVVPHQTYQFHVERRDGRTVRWLVDDMEILTYRDPEPLLGPGHEHLGFNDWQVRLCFDNLRVTPLGD
jgi:hypothetical protein